MLNEAEANRRQALARGSSALYQARALLWQVAEEDGDAGRNADRWNEGGEGFTLLAQITAVLPPMEALRADLLSQESPHAMPPRRSELMSQSPTQMLAFHREVVRVLEDVLQVAASEEINTPADERRHLRFVQRSARRGEALLTRARQTITEWEA